MESPAGVWSCMFFFFFSSRRRHTRCSRDWSSDVCSSDLGRRPKSRKKRIPTPSPCSLSSMQNHDLPSSSPPDQPPTSHWNIPPLRYNIFSKVWSFAVSCQGPVAQTHRLPFDRLGAKGGVLKSCDFSVCAELVEA